MNTENYRIYFFANLTSSKSVPLGGGEVGNRRTLHLLQKIGFDVVVIRKYSRVPNHSFLNTIVLFSRMLLNIMQFFFILLLGRRRNSIVHVSGFYGVMIFFEFILVAIAKVLCYKVIYEMRGGGAETFYKTYGIIYKTIFRWNIQLSDYIFTQGEDNYPIIKRIASRKRCFYYPNFIETSILPLEYTYRDQNQPTLIYFGRIAETKNIDRIVSIFINVSSRLKNVKLILIGNGKADYVNNILNTLKNLKLEENFEYHAEMSHDKLIPFLNKSTFFIFPSSEPREGHSNALTEAMSRGVIPISSSQGFSRSVINNDELIIDDLDEEKFADKIVEIVNTSQVDYFSKYVYNRIITNYTENIVKENLYNEYKIIFKSKKINTD